MNPMNINDKLDYWLGATSYYSFIDKVNGKEFSLPARGNTKEIISKYGSLKSALYYLDEKANTLAKTYIQDAYTTIHECVNANVEQLNSGNAKKLLTLADRVTFAGLFLGYEDP